MAPKSVTVRRHDHLVSVLFGDLLMQPFLQQYIFNVFGSCTSKRLAASVTFLCLISGLTWPVCLALNAHFLVAFAGLYRELPDGMLTVNVLQTFRRPFSNCQNQKTQMRDHFLYKRTANLFESNIYSTCNMLCIVLYKGSTMGKLRTKMDKSGESFSLELFEYSE